MCFRTAKTILMRKRQLQIHVKVFCDRRCESRYLVGTFFFKTCKFNVDYYKICEFIRQYYFEMSSKRLLCKLLLRIYSKTFSVIFFFFI